MPASAALARRALPATRDARAGSPPWRVPERTSSSQTPARCAVLPTLPAESQAGQPAPQDWYRCGARSECYHEVSGNKTKASICISSPQRLPNPIPAVGRIGRSRTPALRWCRNWCCTCRASPRRFVSGHGFSRAIFVSKVELGVDEAQLPRQFRLRGRCAVPARASISPVLAARLKPCPSTSNYP